ncbi:type II secretion system protein [Candidatus Beckwithbacteria bacterium]|nr:type II secretion system protein [Candidatus Beckwithbacteria bacterium]
MKKIVDNRGFTLIELLVVIGVIAILAAIVLVAVNPGRQFAQARDTQRRSDLYSITNAIYQYAAEHEGNLPDTDGDDSTSNFPTTPTCIGVGAGCFDLGASTDEAGTETVVPTYIAEIPSDPSTGDAANTGYLINVDGNGRIIASASGEIQTSITVTR